MERMTEAEWRTFVMEGSRTGKLATVRPDGQPHVVPIWFMLDGPDLVFMTGADTVKARNIRHNPHVGIAVDDEHFPFSFVLIQGEATLTAPSPEEMRPYSTAIARRYVGDARADEFGRRNAVEGELLVRVRPGKVVAQKNIAD